MRHKSRTSACVDNDPVKPGSLTCRKQDPWIVGEIGQLDLLISRQRMSLGDGGDQPIARNDFTAQVVRVVKGRDDEAEIGFLRVQQADLLCGHRFP